MKSPTPTQAEIAARKWAAEPGTCINDNCRSKGKKKRATSRGLCAACYMQLWLAEKAGAITWQHAEDHGLCLHAHAARLSRFPDLAKAGM
jgi:hypothetical protein